MQKTKELHHKDQKIEKIFNREKAAKQICAQLNNFTQL